MAYFHISYEHMWKWGELKLFFFIPSACGGKKRGGGKVVRARNQVKVARPPINSRGGPCDTEAKPSGWINAVSEIAHVSRDFPNCFNFDYYRGP